MSNFCLSTITVELRDKATDFGRLIAPKLMLRSRCDSIWNLDRSLQTRRSIFAARDTNSTPHESAKKTVTGMKIESTHAFARLLLMVEKKKASPEVSANKHKMTHFVLRMHGHDARLGSHSRLRNRSRTPGLPRQRTMTEVRAETFAVS